MYVLDSGGGGGDEDGADNDPEYECESCGERVSGPKARRLRFQCENPIHVGKQTPHMLHDRRTIQSIWFC